MVEVLEADLQADQAHPLQDKLQLNNSLIINNNNNNNINNNNNNNKFINNLLNNNHSKYFKHQCNSHNKNNQCLVDLDKLLFRVLPLEQVVRLHTKLSEDF